jgi:SAM-dependent methyltransferase
MRLIQRLLGTPFVYDHIRPLAVGGLDMSPFYERVGCVRDSVVLDIGCGTGDALRYLKQFRRYVGVDTDPIAVEFARRRYAGREDIDFQCRTCQEQDVAALQPTEIVLGGVLHHVPDDVAHQLLKLTASSPRLRRVATLDIVFLPGERLSNLLARLDRGRFCRTPEAYKALARSAGLAVTSSSVVRSHPRTGIAKYWTMTLEREQPLATELTCHSR